MTASYGVVFIVVVALGFVGGHVAGWACRRRAGWVGVVVGNGVFWGVVVAGMVAGSQW
jgi:hypothetical protein